MEGTAASKSGGLLSASALKLIAIIAMTVDHTAWLFIPTESLAGWIMHFIGRMTAPIMCFFISEGYHHTHDLRLYCGRLAVFAVISHYPFRWFETAAFGYCELESVIAVLLMCLISVIVVNSSRIEKAFKVPLIIGILYLAEKCDWGADAVYFTLTFELARDFGRVEQALAYAVTGLVYLLPTIKLMTEDWQSYHYLTYRAGLLVPAVIILLYSGKLGGSRSGAVRTVSKYGFYAYYPLHLIVLTWLRTTYGGQ